MAYKYPYGNRDTINLDWFINEFQKLKAAWEEERAGIEGALDEEIARAEAALADVFAARDAATAAATAASQSADTARGYSETATSQANTATQAAQGATTARSDALAAQSAAEAAADNASGFASNASTSANAADTSAQSAARSVINARTAQSAAAQSATLADSARQAAQTAQTGAETAATNAATSADDAEAAATSIEESAQQITTNTNDISDLKESISKVATLNKTDVNLLDYPFVKGYLNNDGSITTVSGNSTYRTTEPIYLANGEYLVIFSGITGSTQLSYPRGIAIYNNNGDAVSVSINQNVNTFTIEDGQYVRININADTITQYEIVANKEKNNYSSWINENLGLRTDKFLTPIDGTLIDATYLAWQQGYLDTSTGAFVATTGNNKQRTTLFIKLSTEVLYAFWIQFQIDGAALTQPRTIIIYNNDKTYSRTISTNAGYNYFRLTNNEKYVRINLQFDSIDYMYLVDTRAGKDQSYIKLTNILEPAKNFTNYAHARRPLIAFILDGEYDENADMETVFSNHKVNCGFAIPYESGFLNNSILDYLDWQRKGHEILAHSQYAVGTQSTATDAEIQTIVRNSYTRLHDLGFDIRGFVALQGNAKQIAIDEAKKLFDYACTTNNHAGNLTGDLAESNIYFNSDNPYKLWRYSMQTSTIDQMKSAVDRCITTNGLLMFYGHAESASSDNFTPENLDALLTYIESVGATVLKPIEAISDYYSLRYDDIMSSN